jgi:hypothetical protein
MQLSLSTLQFSSEENNRPGIDWLLLTPFVNILHREIQRGLKSTSILGWRHIDSEDLNPLSGMAGTATAKVTR